MYNMKQKSSQPGVEAINEQLAEIRDKSEREKIPLSKEVQEYTRANLRRVQEKLEKGEPVYAADMEFIEKVKIWMETPAWWRNSHNSIEKMDKSGLVDDVRKRDITPQQWLALVYLSTFKVFDGNNKEWIDKAFTFPGNNRIEFDGHLDLNDCRGLSFLPDNLYVKGSFSLRDSASLTVLPDNFRVGLELDLKRCTGLKTIPGDLKADRDVDLSGCTSISSLPDNFSVEGNFWLEGCTELKTLPENMSVKGSLNIKGCAALKRLPNSLEVSSTLILDRNASMRVVNDAHRLKREGKIGDIMDR